LTQGQILKLKCTKFDFGWGSAPEPAGGAYPLAGLKGPTSKEREENGREGGGGGRGREVKGKGREREGRGREGTGKGGEGPPLLFKQIEP